MHPLVKLGLSKSRPVNRAAAQEFKNGRTQQQRRNKKQKLEAAARAEEYVTCKHCGVSVRRRNLFKHERGHRRVVCCVGCKAVIKTKNIEMHATKCKKLLMAEHGG